MNPTALIVIDMQNSFFHPEGENFFESSHETIEPVQQLLTAARNAQCLVVHTLDRHRHGLPDFEQQRLPPHCLEGDMNAEYFDGFGPRPDSILEIEIVKRRYSAFFGTDLAMTLLECGIETVVICGVKTNVCVRATSQDAFANGFSVVVPGAAVSSNRKHLGDASLEDIERYIGRSVELNDAVALLTGDTA